MLAAWQLSHGIVYNCPLGLKAAINKLWSSICVDSEICLPHVFAEIASAPLSSSKVTYTCPMGAGQPVTNCRKAFKSVWKLK